MKLYAGVTDHDWFDYLRSLPAIDEVNFWQPSPNAEFRALSKGDIFLFKLHRSERTHNRDLIAGGGVFAFFSVLPISLAWERYRVFNLDEEALRVEEERARYGKETTIKPRLGQGAFRVLVTDAYYRACAITEEHSLPALEAAHIKPFNESGPHAVNNGLLMRSDFHRLFDRGYITVTPEYKIEVSRRLKEEFENGRSYYPFHGKPLGHLPVLPEDRPSNELLIWHNDNIFRA